MSSREMIIARKLSGLPFIHDRDIQEEFKQCISDYFMDDDDIDNVSELSDSSQSDVEDVGDVPVLSSLEQPEALPSSTRFTSSPTPFENVARNLLDVGSHTAGDEGMLQCLTLYQSTYLLWAWV